MRYPLSPFVFYYTPGDPDMDGLYIKLKSSDPMQVAKAIQFIKETWEEFSPEDPLNIEFLDDARIGLYRQDNNNKKVFLFFSVFAMIISCLGLYGLSGFILARRRKEIGIRKIYGGNDRSLFVLLAYSFLRLVICGIILVIPVTFYFMNKWLQNYSLKTMLDWWIFLLAGTIIVLISLITIGIETWKASTQNPARILKYE